MAEAGTGFTLATLRRRERAVALSVVAFVVVAVVAGALVGGPEVLGYLARVSPGLLATLLALSGANYLLRALRWHLYGRAIGVLLPFRRTLLYYIAGFALTTTPGRVGEALRLWLIARGHGYRYDRLAALLVGDRLSDVHAIVVLAAIGAAWSAGNTLLVAMAAGVALALTVVLAHPAWAIALAGAAHDALGRRWRRPFARIRRALRHTGRLFNGRVAVAGLGLAIGGWLGECLAFYILLAGFGAEVTPIAAGSVFALATLMGAVAMLPGRLGGAEVTMVGLLIALGVDPGAAVAATAVIRLTTLWFAVGLGFIALPLALRGLRRPMTVPAA